MADGFVLVALGASKTTMVPFGCRRKPCVLVASLVLPAIWPDWLMAKAAVPVELGPSNFTIVPFVLRRKP